MNSYNKNIPMKSQVLWHQTLLVFVQRYKLEFNDNQRERLRALLKATKDHHQITMEVKRELAVVGSG